MTSLVHLAGNGDLAGIRELIRTNPNVNLNETNCYGYTALIEAAYYGHTEIVKELLKQKELNLNIQNEGGYTALISAADNGHTEIVKELLKQKGVDLNLQDEGGFTALISAADNGHTEILKELLKQKGVDLNIQDYNGKTALQLAEKRGNRECVALLRNPSSARAAAAVPVPVPVPASAAAAAAGPVVHKKSIFAWLFSSKAKRKVEKEAVANKRKAEKEAAVLRSSNALSARAAVSASVPAPAPAAVALTTNTPSSSSRPLPTATTPPLHAAQQQEKQQQLLIDFQQQQSVFAELQLALKEAKYVERSLHNNNNNNTILEANTRAEWERKLNRLDERFQCDPLDKAERSHIRSNQHLSDYYTLSQKIFNEAFLVSSALSTGMIQVNADSTVGDVFGTLSELAKSVNLPFVPAVLSFVARGVEKIAEVRQERRYTFISNLCPTSSAVDQCKFSEILARYLTITYSSQIISMGGEVGQEDTSTIELETTRKFIGKIKEKMKEKVSQFDKALAEGLIRTESTPVELLVYRHAKAVLEYVMDGKLEEVSGLTQEGRLKLLVGHAGGGVLMRLSMSAVSKDDCSHTAAGTGTGAGTTNTKAGAEAEAEATSTGAGVPVSLTRQPSATASKSELEQLRKKNEDTVKALQLLQEEMKNLRIDREKARHDDDGGGIQQRQMQKQTKKERLMNTSDGGTATTAPFSASHMTHDEDTAHHQQQARAIREAQTEEQLHLLTAKVLELESLLLATAGGEKD